MTVTSKDFDAAIQWQNSRIAHEDAKIADAFEELDVSPEGAASTALAIIADGKGQYGGYSDTAVLGMVIASLLIGIKVAPSRGQVEQDLENEQVRRLRRDGRCPTCGADG